MSRLEYRTLTDSKPRDRQRIYFCCHPDDFDKYFEGICSDIFSVNKDCAIYYDAEPDPKTGSERFLSELGQMQLFVVAITKKLLESECSARDYELPFARGRIGVGKEIKNIAVLPILLGDNYQELETLFGKNDCLRELQFIDKYQRGKAADTSVSYREKLKKRIESVLMGEEQKKLIRSHFRARLFMSYRKDDRALLLDLIRRIQKIDFCRDVATWYDEFLTPGEKWEDALGQEIKNCDLVVLSMTRNMLMAGNYVLENEFPEAVRYKRPVLPVETEKVDREDITVKFPLPCPNGDISGLMVPFGDDEALKEALDRELIVRPGREELRNPNDDPQHMYYIGLAYKNGIDVVADADKTVGLLERSGAGGFCDAYYTLGKMFEHGDAVAVDTERAMGYYEKFIAGYRSRFGTSKEGDLELLEAFDAKGMILHGRGKLSQALECYRDLNGLLLGMKSCYGSFQQLNLPTSYERLSMISREQGDYDAAKAYLDKAMEVRRDPPRIRNIAAEDETSELDPQEYNELVGQTGYAVTLYSIGQLLLHNGDIDGAEWHYEKAYKLLSRYTEKSDDQDRMLMLAKACCSMGEVSVARLSKQAEKYYAQAKDILDRLIKNEENLEARRMSIINLMYFGDLYRKVYPNAFWQKSKEYYESALEKLGELMKLDSGEEVMSLLSLVYERLGLINTALGNSYEAKKHFESYLELSRNRAAERSEDPESQRSLSMAYENLAKNLMDSGDLIGAQEYYRRSIEITERLSKQNKGDMQTKRDLSVGYDGLSRLYKLLGNKEKALEYAVRDYVITQDIASCSEGISYQIVDDLAVSFFNIGTLCLDVRQECFLRAKNMWYNLYRETKSPGIKNKLKMIDVAYRINDTQTTVPMGYCRSLEELVRRFAGDTPINEDILSAFYRAQKSSHFLFKLFILFAIFTVLTYFGITDKIIDWFKSLF